jgi:DNA-binding Xre family transcriptional regulator
MPLKWKLRSLLEHLTINPHQLARQMGIAPPSVYRLLRDEGPENFNRGTLENILTALEALTGKTLEIADLIEYERKSKESS